MMRKKFIPGAVVALAICASAAVPASAANGAGRWWVVFDRQWNEYDGYYAHRGAPIVIKSSRSLATVMDEVWAW